VEKVYGFEPVPASLTPAEAKHILGAQAQVWTEYIPNPKHVEYMAYPRLVALTEVLWSPASRRDYADFLQRLPVHLRRLDALDVNYRRLDAGRVQ
jgi:hexosaminidase